MLFINRRIDLCCRYATHIYNRWQAECHLIAIDCDRPMPAQRHCSRAMGAVNARLTSNQRLHIVECLTFFLSLRSYNKPNDFITFGIWKMIAAQFIFKDDAFVRCEILKGFRYRLSQAQAYVKRFILSIILLMLPKLV